MDILMFLKDYKVNSIYTVHSNTYFRWRVHVQWSEKCIIIKALMKFPLSTIHDKKDPQKSNEFKPF